MDPQTLIQDYLDGELNNSQFGALCAWLEQSEDNRVIFMQSAMLDSDVKHHLENADLHRFLEEVDVDALHEVIQQSQEDSTAALLSITDAEIEAGHKDDLTFKKAVRVLSRSGWQWAGRSAKRHAIGLGLAAAVLLAVTLAIVFSGGGATPQTPISPGITAQTPNEPAAPKPNYVAMVTSQHEAEWLTAGVGVGVGDRLVAGRQLTLSSGLAELTTSRGARVILEGPCIIELTDKDNELRLYEGKLFGVCETIASQGFTVLTENARVVDIGTKFGVKVEANGDSFVHVFEGEVVAKPLGKANQRTRSLLKGNALAIEDEGKSVRRIDHDPQAFVTDTEFLIRRVATPEHRRWLTQSMALRKHKDLIAYYTFDEALDRPDTLVNLAAQTRGRFDGRLTTMLDPNGDGPDWSEGRWPGKGALRFDRVAEDAVRVPFKDVKQIDRALSIVMWVRFDELESDQHLVAQKAPARDRGLTRLNFGWNGTRQQKPYRSIFFAKGMIADKSSLRFRIAPEFKADQWVCLAIVSDGQKTRYYLNGEAFSAYDDTVPYLGTSADLTIGYADHMHDVKEAFGGSIDELSIFKTALNGDQIKDFYEAGKP